MTESEPRFPPGPPYPATDRLRRVRHGRLVAGVAAGVAEYLDVDVTLVRIALVALAFVGGVGIPIYLAGWLLMPEEDDELSVAETWLGHVHPHGDFHAHAGHGPGTSGVAL
ncbi:MAG TPA: PspC domain-containing protein [Acidimicrobiales bacterium]|nr:PspC domain-containing protein [Acidimicrobiales bacterium]